MEVEPPRLTTPNPLTDVPKVEAITPLRARQQLFLEEMIDAGKLAAAANGVRNRDE